MGLLAAVWSIAGKAAAGRRLWKLFNGAVFLAAVSAVLYATIYSRGEAPQPAVLMPFSSFQEAKIQPELYRSMLMNVFLFQPIGLSLPNILPKKAHPVALTASFALLLSVGVEAAQFWFQLGRCETDDVIMNTLGAVIGCAAYQSPDGFCRPEKKQA